jgi:NADPH-dependent 2,4-dienoyl-CoA reductase/sulfur reductase-like enzyme
VLRTGVDHEVVAFSSDVERGPRAHGGGSYRLAPCREWTPWWWWVRRSPGCAPCRRCGAPLRGRVDGDRRGEELPYDRPPLSKEVLAGKWDVERTRLLRPEDEDLAVEWRLGKRAESLDLAARRVGLAGGESVPFDGLVIATGTFARKLPGAPPLAGIHVLRTLSDCLALRAELDRSPRVAVIGAGFIGLEVAATCRGRGLGVSVIESLAAPLERGLGAALGAMWEIHATRVSAALARRWRAAGAGRVEAVELRTALHPGRRGLWGSRRPPRPGRGPG